MDNKRGQIKLASCVDQLLLYSQDFFNYLWFEKYALKPKNNQRIFFSFDSIYFIDLFSWVLSFHYCGDHVSVLSKYFPYHLWRLYFVKL